MDKIAIFAHDAGGSEILLELLKASLHVGEFRVFCVENSPCGMLIKNKKLCSYKETIEPNKTSVFDRLSAYNPELILYATSWQNHFEYYFLAYAKKHNIPSMAFLDNWTNFRERFGYPKQNWQENFPDFIATHDETSEKLAISLGLKNVITIKNYSLEKQLKEYSSLDIKEEDRLLFLSEPTAKVAKKSFGDENYWGFTEKDVLKSVLKFSTCKDIVVRLHPSDEAEVYKDVAISSDTLLEDIARAKVIVGIDSSALYLAFLLGKTVISYMPSNNRDFFVPLPKSNQVRALEDIDTLKINDNTADIFGIDFALFIKGEL